MDPGSSALARALRAPVAATPHKLLWFSLLGRDIQYSQPVARANLGLFRRILVFRLSALSVRQRDRREEREHEPEDRVNRVPRRDHAQRREHQDRGEEVEQCGLESHVSGPNCYRYLASSARSFAICASYRSPTASSISFV